MDNVNITASNSIDDVTIIVTPNVTIVEVTNGLGGVTKHSELDLDDGTNPHGTTKSDVGLSDVPNLSFSGSNTGDETTSSIQTKRPLKTINSESLEGIGNIEISGGGSAALTFTFTGLDVTDGSIDLTGQTGMPVAGSFPSALRVYYDDNDISQSASFTPSTQILFAGFTGEETTITIKITF